MYDVGLDADNVELRTVRAFSSGIFTDSLNCTIFVSMVVAITWCNPLKA